MQDDILNRPRPAPPRAPGTGKTMLIVAALAFVMGAGLIGWLAWKGTLAIPGRAETAQSATSAGQAAIAALPITPSASASPPFAPAPAAVEAVLDQRLANLEERLTRLDLQAQAAAGNAGRAEGLLIALAARRALERGAPLGYLEDQLKLRFAAAQPNAVSTILAAAAQPVTLDQLVARLDALEPTLTSAPKAQGGWSRLQAELSGLFTIRRNSAPASRPEDRLSQARLLLQTGQVEAAMGEVQRLPGADGARDWLASARRYAGVQQALDLIETAAILEPRALQDAAGAKVEQPSPVTQPAA